MVAKVHHVSRADQAYTNILNRLVDDLGPVWHQVNHTDGYSPFWLLVRSMMPIAESVGYLIYGHDSTSRNLEDLIDNQLAKARPVYAGKGALIAVLYRHSFMHQDEPGSIYSGNITINWQVAYWNGENHLVAKDKNKRSRSCTMQFDLRAFYEDLQQVLNDCIKHGPRNGVVKRYNSWTFLNLNTADKPNPKKRVLITQQVLDFYKSG